MARRSAALQLLQALAAGALTVFAFAPFAQGWVAVLTLAWLFHLWRYPARPGLSKWLGYAFGVGLLSLGVFWLRISIAQFGGVNPALAVTVTVLFVLAMALYYGLAGLLVERLQPRSDVAWLILVVPSVWVLTEWLRGWLFTGFPWLAVGYSQLALPTAGYGTLLGVFGISLVVAMSAALINLLFARRIRLALSGLAMLWLTGLAVLQVPWTEPNAEPIRVSLLQGNVPQAQKWLPSMRVPTLRRYIAMTEAVPDSQLVIWPETAVPAFADEVEERWLTPLHRRHVAQQRDLLIGIVAGDPKGEYFNAMMGLGASGRDRYDKRHLVPFGEYLPFDRWTRPVLDWLSIPMSDFTPGEDRPPVITLAGQPVGINICYEDAYADEVLRAMPQATLLVNASNDAWFGDSLAPHQHLEIARMRALETGRYLLRATNTGISAIIGIRGEVQQQSPQFEQATLTAMVTPHGGLTPFARVGQGGVVAIALLMLALAWRLQRAMG